MTDSSFVLSVYSSKPEDDPFDEDETDSEDTDTMSDMLEDPKPDCKHNIFSLAIQINNHMLS